MMSDNSDDSDDSSAQEYIPRGVLKGHRKGWEGEELELEHQRETISSSKAGVTVDLNQFRNFEVGKGYQAKHVIRQQSASSEKVNIKDMTGGSSMRKSDKQTMDSKKRTKHGSDDNNNDEEIEHKEKRRKNLAGDDDPKAKLEKYLACEGLRSFREEIEKILAS